MYMNHGEPVIDEDDVERDMSILHPEIPHLILVVNKEHTPPGGQRGSVHESLRLLLESNGRLRQEEANFTTFSIVNDDGYEQVLRRAY